MHSDLKSTSNSINISTDSKNTKDVATLGQVFTPINVVKFMVSLIQNNGPVLEPSCGDGVFLPYLPKSAVAIELDSKQAPSNSLNIDFFDFPETEKFSTIIGNPPYVRFQDILETTKLKLNDEIFDKRSNLYLFFIEKCIRHLKENGEIIFIVPREFIKSTSSRNLNDLIFKTGTITHLIDFGDSKLFEGAVPNCVVFRFEKDNFSRDCIISEINVSRTDNVEIEKLIKWEDSQIQLLEGHFFFSKEKHKLSLKDIAEVKVGAVSGIDSIYANNEIGNRDFVYSGTVKDGSLKKMYWPEDPDEAKTLLAEYKEILISRKIRNFTEHDWWNWGRGFPDNKLPRIYVNGKTRNPNPFFNSECTNFDGAVLAIFPRNREIDLKEFAEELNSLDWQKYGFLCDGRFLFSQRSLENCPLPDKFEKFI